MRHEQAPDPPPLRLVGDEKQVELRRSEDQRVEAEDPAAVLLAVDRHETAVGPEVIRPDPVARDRRRVLPRVGTRATHQPGEPFGSPGDGPPYRELPAGRGSA